MAKNPAFAVKGTITVKDSGTVLLVRRRPGGPKQLTAHDCGNSKFLRSQSVGVFGSKGRIIFESGWEVLLGQSEVVNWLRTTPKKLATMRYGGEWKLAGGNVGEGETIVDAAFRELQEEFIDPLGLSLPKSTVLRPFVTKQTRPIRSRSNLMHCFVALESENKWLRNLDIDAINDGLRHRRREFERLSLNPDGTPTKKFYSLPESEREAVTPEVRQCKWVPLHDAVKFALSSMGEGVFVNDYQKECFRKYGKKRRDPMFITAAILMELEGFPDSNSLIAHCRSVDLEALTREEQWLFKGMDQQQVDDALAERLKNGKYGTNPSFKNPDVISGLRKNRNERKKLRASL